MEERPELQTEETAVPTRRRQYTKRQLFWKRYGPTVQFLAICAVLLAVVILVGGKLIGLVTGSDQPDETTGTTESSSDALTQEQTEEATEAPTTYLYDEPVGGVIYLTFDDGPGPETPRLLEILDKYDAKATFFVVNTGFASTISQIADHGHALAMHTATHDFAKVYASEEAYFDDLHTIEAVIEKYAGQKSTLLRFPGGSSNTVSRTYTKGIMTRLTQMVEEQGYTYFDWNVDSDDAGSARTPEEVYFNVIRGCAKRESSVVLMHDIHSYTIDAVEGILIWGTNHGYTFEALTPDSPTCHHGINN